MSRQARRKAVRFFPTTAAPSKPEIDDITYEEHATAYNAPLGEVRVPEGIKPLKGAEVFVQSLRANGCDLLFGYPGGANLEIFDVLPAAGIRCVRTEHEQGAAHAAEGFARAAGRVGVCLATSGPGATNLVTGIADANSDSVPIVAITGQVPSFLMGKNAFQEVNIVDICRPITKAVFLVRRVIDIPAIVHEAFATARGGRPGPVLIDFPKDVQQQYAVDRDGNYIDPEFDVPPTSPPTAALHGSTIDQVCNMIQQSRRPVIYAGGGVISADAGDLLVSLAEKTRMPVTTTVMGLGAIPPGHPLCIDVLGMHGTKYANDAVNEADLVIAVGVRFDDRVTGKVSEFIKHGKIVHIDVDPSEINKNKPVEVGIVGDLRVVLRALIERVGQAQSDEWLAMLTEAKTRWPLLAPRLDDVISPPWAIKLLSDMTDDRAVVTVGVGQHQMWAMQHYKVRRPRSFISSSGFGTMGFGLPAAIGAAVGCPDRLVIDIDGDGSLNMTVQELSTVHRYQLALKIVVINNQFLGMVRQWQDMIYRRHRAETSLADPAKVPDPNRPVDPRQSARQGAESPEIYPDFLQIAAGYRIPAQRVWRPQDLTDAYTRMFETDGPYLLDVVVAAEENVYPMIPAGGTYKDVILTDRND